MLNKVARELGISTGGSGHLAAELERIAARLLASCFFLSSFLFVLKIFKRKNV
jgi:hypothetical protein